MKELIPVRRPDLSIDFFMDLNNTFIADSNTKKYTVMHGSCEPEVVSVMARILKSGDTAIDGGANVGYFSLVMASIVGTPGKVLAFEPGPNNVPKLRANLDLNDAKQVQVVAQPLWSSQKEVMLHMAIDSGKHSLRQHQTFGSQKMEATTIDAWHVAPKLIKLDIEGSEIEALIGAQDTISAYSPYIICELNEDTLNLFGKTGRDLREYVKNTFDYDTFFLSKHVSYPAFVPRKTKIVTMLANTNVLFATTEMIEKAWPEFAYAQY